MVCVPPVPKTTRFSSISRAIVFAAGILTATPSASADEVSLSDLEAATRTLGFVENLPKDGILALGVVFASQAPESRALALDVAERLRGLAGPNSLTIKTDIIAADSISQYAGRLDALFILPGVSGEGAAIADAVRLRRLVSISNDPRCLDQQCCVLMVRTAQDVEIVLNGELAKAAETRFSSVFAMMVKRK